MTRVWQRIHPWVEPWYVAYALLGAAAAGLLPILLPLATNSSGNIASVGLVVAAFNLGGMTAPLWGSLADRYRLHRWLLGGGLITTALAVAVFPAAPTTLLRVILAFIQGTGATGSATVANLFVVEAHPKEEWDERIGWLQTFYGGGQVIGLLLAGAAGEANLSLALEITAGITLLAGFLGWSTAHTPPQPAQPRPKLILASRHTDQGIGSPQRHYHTLGRESLKNLSSTVHSPFGLFLLAWLLSFAGAAAVFSLYPVLMQQAFGVQPGVSSSVFALAAGLGLALYSPAGQWVNRQGPRQVVLAGLGARLLAFVALIALTVIGGATMGILALVTFLVVVVAWSLLSVGGTLLTANLSPVGEGEGMGFFNAVTGLAGVAGALLGGWAAARLGYTAVAGLAAAGVALGMILLFRASPAKVKNSAGGKE